MKQSSLRLRLSLVLVALAAMSLLLAPGASADPQPVPKLQSTAQYQAFIGYVAKLRGLQNKPATDSRKAFYERQLSTKHNATVKKASALFKRSKRQAGITTKQKVAVGVAKLNKAEATKLDSIQDDADARSDAASANYQRRVDALQSTYDLRFDRFRKEIQALRKQKANAKGVIRKSQIQRQINTLIGRVADNKAQEAKDLAKLKDELDARQAAIQKAADEDSADVRKATANAIDALRDRLRAAYNAQVATFQARLQNQKDDLDAKLDAGRFYIARMPAV